MNRELLDSLIKVAADGSPLARAGPATQRVTVKTAVRGHCRTSRAAHNQVTLRSMASRSALSDDGRAYR